GGPPALDRRARRRADLGPRPRGRPGRLHRHESRGGRPAHRDRVPAAPRAGAPAPPGLHARAPAGAGLELRVPRRLPARGRGRAAAPLEGGGRPEGTDADPHRARRRLPARPVMSLRRRLTIALMVAVGLSAGALAAGSYVL